METREQFLNEIQSNIKRYGYHVTIVNGKLEPRYAYSIGLKNIIGKELIFAGGVFFNKEGVFKIFQDVVIEIQKAERLIGNSIISSLGIFSLRATHPTWSRLMMLGVYDFYNDDKIEALQILPSKENYTLDIPDMSIEFDQTEPIWKWLVKEWDLKVPMDSSVITDISAMQGETIVEVMRWEDNEWEMFSGPGPDVPKAQKRVVSLATLLGVDTTLTPSINLPIGKGMWRDALESDWTPWG